jgi:hypothetical protein
MDKLDLTQLSANERDKLLKTLLKLHQEDPNHRINGCSICITPIVYHSINDLVNWTDTPFHIPDEMCDICYKFIPYDEEIWYRCYKCDDFNRVICPSCKTKSIKYGMGCSGIDEDGKSCQSFVCKKCMDNSTERFICDNSECEIEFLT